MRSGWRGRAWARAAPVVWTVLPVLFVLSFAIIGRRGPGGAPLPASSPLSWGLTVLACVALLVRLRRPVEVWVVVLASSTLQTVLDGFLGRTVPAVLVAVYTVATLRPWKVATAAGLGSSVALLAVVAAASQESVFSEGTYPLLAFGGMFTAVGIAVRNQRSMVEAADDRARMAELTREEEAQRRVAQERLRIARELHDVVAHHISVINVQSAVARHLLTSDPAAADAALGAVRSSAALVLREMASILGLLRTSEDPAVTDPVPGIGRVGELVDGGRAVGLDLQWTTTGSPRPLAPAADLAAYRLVQEALTNARRHGTGQATLLVDWRPDGLVLEVGNPVPDPPPGQRAAPARGAVTADGHGLRGMRERVAAAGGRLDVRAAGTFVVRAELPYDVVEATPVPDPAAGGHR